MAEHLGLSFRSSLSWQHWEPATLYTKRLVLRNVGTKVCRVKHALPKDGQFFRADFPKRVAIPPGVSYGISVTFAPLKKIEYSDSFSLVVAQVGGVRETFDIKLKATLPKVNVALTHQDGSPCNAKPVAFGYVSVVGGVCSKELALRNVGEVPVRFSWKCEEPFKIVPESGDLAPGAQAKIVASFAPKDAAPFSCVAVCRLNDGEDHRTLHMRGCGKFPYFRVSSDRVSFGEVPAGRVLSREITLTNPGLVPCPVAVSGPSAGGQCFDVSPRATVTLAPGESKPVKITFRSATIGARHSATIVCRVPSFMTSSTVRLEAATVGPTVTLSGQSVSFGAVAIGTSTSRIITLSRTPESNPSTDVWYEVLCDHQQGHGVFRFEPSVGKIDAGKQDVHIAVRFHPGHPLAYAKVVYVLVEGHPPLPVDLTGTGFYDPATSTPAQASDRPPTFLQRHLDNARALFQKDRRLRRYPPEKVNEYQQQQQQEEATMSATKNTGRKSLGSARIPKSAHFKAQGSEADVPKTLQASTTRAGSAGAGVGKASDVASSEDANGRYREDVAERKDIRDEISVEVVGSRPGGDQQQQQSPSFVDFGQCSAGATVERTLRIKNNTLGRIVCVWVSNTFDDSAQKSQQPKDPLFSILPVLSEIEPNHTQTFQVTFKPTGKNQCFGEDFECYVHYKSMRSFRLVTERTILPPWNLCLPLFGHTFGSADGTERLASQIVLGSNASNVQFKTVPVGACDYQSFRISCSGELPASFDLAGPEGLSSIFELYPSRGYVLPGQHRIITAVFHPGTLGSHRVSVPVMVNGSRLITAGSLGISLSGACCSPEASFDCKEGKVIFSPACVGAKSQQTLRLRNANSLDLIWRFEPPLACSSVASQFKMSPMFGVLHGDETIDVQCFFVPRDAGKQTVQLRVPCILNSCATTAGGAQTNSPGDRDDTAIRREVVFVGQCVQEPAVEIVDPIAGSAVKKISFGDVVLSGGRSTHRLLLRNNSHSLLHFKLCVSNNAGGAVTFSPRNGSVQARTSIPLVFEFAPLVVGSSMHTARVVIDTSVNDRVRDLEYSGGKTSPPPEHPAILCCSDSDDDGYGFDEDVPGKKRSLVCYTVSLEGNGTVPTLAVTNLFHDRNFSPSSPSSIALLSKAEMWRRLRVSDVNEFLRGVTNVFFDDDLSTLDENDRQPHYDVDFGTVISSQETVSRIGLQFTNVGSVALSFSLRFKNEPELPVGGKGATGGKDDISWWSEKHEDLTEVEAREKGIVQEGIFQVAPRRAELQPGQSQVVTLSHRLVPGTQYQRDEIGVVVSVTGGRGKTFVLNLRATNKEAPGETEQVVVPLDATPITSPTPVHFFKLCNPSSQTLLYRVVLPEPVNGAFRCDNPSGSLVPGGVAWLRWVFSPDRPVRFMQTAAVEYYVTEDTAPVRTVRLHLDGCGSHASRMTSVSAKLLINGRAEEDVEDDSREWKGLPKPDDVLVSESSPSPAVVAIIPESVTLGDVPLGTVQRRLVTLRNLSQKDEYRFRWDVDSALLPTYQETFVSPAEGCIKPGGLILCKLCVTAKDLPAVLTFDVPCLISKASAVGEEKISPEKDKQQQPTAEEEKEEIFAMHTAGPSAASKKAPVRKAASQSKQKAAVSPAASSEPKEGWWQNVLTLNVRLKSHMASQFVELSGGAASVGAGPLDEHYFPPSCQPEASSDSSSGATDMAEQMCLSMLNDVFADPEVCKALEDVTQNQLPYFSELKGGCQDRSRISSASSSDTHDQYPPTDPPASHDPLLIPEFQELAETTIDATISNLMREALAGVWDLTTLPK